MELATGLAVLFVGVALAWAAEPGRLPWRLPARALRLGGLLLIVSSARWFVGSSGVFVGVVQLLVGFSLVASTVALAGPLLHPRIAALATGCVAVLAVALEIAR